MHSVNSWLDTQLYETLVNTFPASWNHHSPPSSVRWANLCIRTPGFMHPAILRYEASRATENHKLVIQSMLSSCHRLKGGEQKRCMDAFDGHLHSVRVHGFFERRIGMFCIWSLGVPPLAILGHGAKHPTKHRSKSLFWATNHCCNCSLTCQMSNVKQIW